MGEIEHDTPNPDAEHRILSQRLREAREYLGLSQEYVAEQLGIPRAAISAIETCKRKVSSIELKQFAKLYRRTPEYLLDHDEEEFNEKDLDETIMALYHTAKELSPTDKKQVLNFAEFLRQAGTVPPSER